MVNNLTTVLLITVVSTVVFMVTFEGQGDAGTWGQAAKLVGRVTGRSGWGHQQAQIRECRFLKIIYLMHLHYEKSDTAEYLRHSCSSLMSPQSLSLSHFQMLLMQRPLEQRYWLGKQLCSDWRNRRITWTTNKSGRPLWDKDHISYSTRSSLFYHVCFHLTGLDAGVVLELVSGGTLALQLSIGHGYSRGAVWANTGVPVSRLRQTQQAARLVGTGVMPWWKRVQDLKCWFTANWFWYSNQYFLQVFCYLQSLFLTSVLPFIEDFKVHDSRQPANNQLVALGTSFWSFEDPHSGPVVPVQVILKTEYNKSLWKQILSAELHIPHILKCNPPFCIYKTEGKCEDMVSPWRQQWRTGGAAPP